MTQVSVHQSRSDDFYLLRHIGLRRRPPIPQTWLLSSLVHISDTMAFSPILSTLRSGCASRLVARQNFPRTASISRCTSLPRTSTSIAHNILEKTQSRPFSLSSKLRQAATPTESATTPLGNLASSIATKSAQKVKGNAWPETTSKAAGYWLIGSAVSVFGIVVLGGLTRLTESG